MAPNLVTTLETSDRGDRFGSVGIGAGITFLTGPDDQYDDPDNRERDQPPPSGPADVVQASNADCKARQETDKAEDRVDGRGKIILAEHRIIDDRRNDAADQGEEDPKPIFRTAGAACKRNVVPKSRRNGLRKIHVCPRKRSRRAAYVTALHCRNPRKPTRKPTIP